MKMKAYDISIKEKQIAHLRENQENWNAIENRSIEEYFDEYWAQYEGEGIAEGDGPGKLYACICSDMGINPLPELIGEGFK